MNVRRLLNTTKAAMIAALFVLYGNLVRAESWEAPANTQKKTMVSGKKVITKNRKMKGNSSPNSFSSPDFAYPESVEKNATPEWKRALAERDGLLGLRAGLQLVVANNLVNSDDFNRNIEMLDSAVRVMPPLYASLFRLLQADLYTNLYNEKSWVFDRRTLPTDTFPADPQSWSKELFAKKVHELVMRAADNPAESRKVSIKEISSVLTDEEAMVEAGCSVNDFIVYKSTEILQKFATTPQEILPFGQQKTIAASYTDLCSELSTSLIDTLLKYRENAGNEAALVLTVVRKGELLNDAEKVSFLKKWKDKLIDSPYAARVLVEYFNVYKYRFPDNGDTDAAYYAQLKGWLEKYPTASGADAVKYCLATLTMPSMRISLSRDNYPGKEIKGSVNMANIDKGYLLIYILPSESADDGKFNVSKFPNNARFLKAVEVTAKGKIPFSETVEIQIGALEAGAYIIVPSQTPTLSKNWKSQTERWNLQPLNVSEITLFTSYDSQDEKSGKIYVVDAMNQRPVKGASVTVLANSDKVIKRGVTDEEGAFPLPAGYSRSYATFGKSYASASTGFYSYERDKQSRKCATILTDLSIYKPGNEVKFVLVEWLNENNSNRLLKDEAVEVVLRDANWNSVDTLTLKTDSYGRAHGSFKIPSTGLLGTLFLEALEPGNGNNILGRTNFEVADYKTPGFLVALEKTGADDEKGMADSISFKGAVKTYSGMPLGDTKVEFKITWRPWWRWGGSFSNASYNSTVTTDSNGDFMIKLPTAKVKGSQFEHGIFTLTAEATSSAGETQKSQALNFTIGNAYSVMPSFADKICVTSDSIRLNVPVYDMLNLPAIKDVAYRINHISENNEEGDVVKEGKFVSPLLELPSTLLPSGKYRLTFNLEGDTVKTNSELVVFRKDDETPPYATALWIPENTIYTPDGAKTATVKFGSGYADSWVLAVVSDPKGIISRKWINISNADTGLEVPAPAAGSKTWVNLAGLHDYDQKKGVVTLEPESSRKKMEVKASTFRNTLTSGEEEKWKFTFSLDSMPVKNLPAFAVMTDKALNAIRPFSWTFNPERGGVYNTIGGSSINLRNIIISAKFNTLPKYSGLDSFIPSWNTYGYGLGMSSRYAVREYYMAGNVLEVNDSSVKNEMYDMEEQVVKSAAPLAMARKSKATGIKMEDAMEEVATDAGDAEPGSTNGNSKEPELRPMEMPLAFFLPELTGDADGNVEVEFTVPNFNTTWQFQIYGYNDELMTAGMILDAVASKKVMVQTNAPRFLRTGDTAEISAIIFNNSENTEKLTGEIVLFNPLNGETICSSHESTSEVVASGNRRISINFEVPADITSIGVRTVGSSGQFSDGEQTVIPVLPSSTPLIESTQFYLGRDKNTFTVKLPKYPADANLTLRYCSNPVWECILALPSISTPESKNVLTLMRALYANVTAGGIVEKYPEVKAELGKIFSDKDKSTEVMTSNLEKDENLKSVALSETPWVNNASSETQRLRNLSELLEDGKAAKASAELLEEVKNLQNTDGGWSWCSGMQSSEFITRSVLARFGMMKRNDNLPKDANSMVKKGVSYCDKKVYEDYVKSKNKFSTYDMLDYLYVRSDLEEGVGSTGFSSLRSKALKAIAEEWKTFGISEKAMAAVVMARSKGYERYAGEILESLRQYAVKDADKGWQFANIEESPYYRDRLKVTTTVLEAFAEIEPKAEAVDGLRQWLVLQKETEDWGYDSNTVEVIQAILDSGTDWTEAAPLPEVRIGGKAVKIDNQSQPSGIATVALDPRKSSGKELTISKNTVIPSWGAVISQYVAPIKDVKSERCENLKIEKQILRIDANESGENAFSGDLKVGDKVRVTLTVTCDKDMDYVAIVDERPSCLSPDEQLSGYTFNDGRGMYREVRDTRTTLFLYNLPKGVNVFSYDCHVDREGEYANGIATVQSLYSPQQVAHSAGEIIKIK